MSYDEWIQVQKVHLLGTFNLTRLAWPYFSEKKFGRVINITSTSGIYGNFGQANYSSAKAAILGLTKTIAIEGAKSNIKVNVVAPHAETAMTLTIFREEDKNLYHPDAVAPLLVYLASEDVPVTGEIFEIGGGWIGNTRWQRSKGVVAKTDADVTAEFVNAHIEEIIDFESGSTNPKSTTESSMEILSAIGGDDDEDEDEEEEEDEDDDDDIVDPVWHYNDRDVILYNLSLIHI